MKTVYVETSVVSYLTALPSRDLIVAAWQTATRAWWDTKRRSFRWCTSQLVVAEAGAGHPDAPCVEWKLWPPSLTCRYPMPHPTLPPP
jgi:hypothetical protein